MNKQIVLGTGLAGLVAALILLVASLTGSVSIPHKVIGEATNFDQVGAGDSVKFAKLLSIGAGEQYDSWTNTTGAQLQINLRSFITSGTASTAAAIAMGTSSAAAPITTANPLFFGLSVMDGGGIYASGTATSKNMPFAGLMDWVPLATSTVATSTTSTDVRANGQGMDSKAGSLTLESGESVWILLVCGDEGSDSLLAKPCSGTEGDVTGNLQEPATSTARGYNISALIDFVATSTISN